MNKIKVLFLIPMFLQPLYAQELFDSENCPTQEFIDWCQTYALEPGEFLRIEPPKKENYMGPPSLIIEPVFIHNQATIIPTKGTVQFGGQTLKIKGSRLIMLPPRVLEKTILRINIKGFQEWSIGLRYNMKERKILRLPIELTLK